MTTRVGFAAGWVSAFVLLASAGCSRSKIEEGLDRAHAGSRQMVRRVDDGLEQAKRDAASIQAKLPALPSPEQVESQVNAAKDSVSSKLEAARGHVQVGVDYARDALR